jgi:hypothetical protein
MDRFAASLLSAVLLMLTAGGANAAPEASAQKPMHVDKSFSMPTPDGCRYNATVKGEVMPAKGKEGAQGLVVPKLVVNADLQCADGASLRFPETVKDTGPMTKDQLEKVIADKSTVTSPSAPGGRVCVYSPDFELYGRRLALASITSACPLPT